ncbi:Subtilisin-like protease [Hordeum vulgare]|nr:Subtilisin-like protease [Hordeum vulgare]
MDTRNHFYDSTSSASVTSIDKVSELIDDDTWSWRQDAVRDTFSPSDVAAILNIPIRQGGGEDFLAWAFDKSGNHTVKMTYRALVIQEELCAQEERAATRTSQTDQQLWKALWKLKVIPKVRVSW